MKLLLKFALVLAILGACGYFGTRAYGRLTKGPSAAEIPTSKVSRGDLQIDISAKGELQGGNPEALTAPMVAGGTLHITYLRKPGEAIKTGDIVVQFDTSEQEYKLKEAESDLAEAEQKLSQAQANREAEEEEGRYLLAKAKSDVLLAELETKKNPLVPSITARENDLAVQSAKDHLQQVERNLEVRGKTGGASVAMEEAGRSKARSQATTARQNIESMTLRAHRAGYVSINQAVPTNGFFFGGMVMPLYQIGDAVNPGVNVATIPDLQNWQIQANIGELDRGHIAVGNPVSISVTAVPDRVFHGSVKELGGTTGPFWDRHFECRISVSDPSPELRPGLSTRLTLTTETLHKVLSVPAQAVFNTGGKDQVYVKVNSSFSARDVKLLRRSDTRAVVDGLKEGDLVALANPLDVAKAKTSDAGPLGAVGK